MQISEHFVVDDLIVSIENETVAEERSEDETDSEEHSDPQQRSSFSQLCEADSSPLPFSRSSSPDDNASVRSIEECDRSISYTCSSNTNLFENFDS